MKKALIFAVFVIFAVLLVGFVLAAPAAPSPTCKINAEIIHVSPQEANSCELIEGTTIPARYLLIVNITKVSVVNNEGSQTCEQLYPINSEKTLIIYKSQINTGDVFESEQIIEGNIHITGDECTGGIYLTNYIISSNNEDNETIVGASCGTVTPGENNACCISKGYSGWDSENFTCIGQKEDNETESDNHGNVVGSVRGENKDCEAWKCSKWNNCINGKQTRSCTKTAFNCTEDNAIPKLTKSCHEKEELKIYDKLRDCPENCTCTGSTSKCSFENGTRVMTIYAGKSGNIIVQVKNVNMSTNVTLYKSINGTLYAVFTGNKTHEIMFPDEIKDRLENHTRTKLYNESIELNEDGQYHMSAMKKAKLFWMFPVKEKVQFNVDSETGNVTMIKTKWWGFLAKDVKDVTNNSTATA